MRILITSGPTRAPLDAVRYLTNRSTGRLGTLLAKEALRRNARVTMVYGQGSETPRPHSRLRLLPIETNQDLERALRQELKRSKYNAVIHAMAVLDFQPNKIRRGKVGSRGGGWTIRLVPTPKIIAKIKRWSPRTFLVSFKLEDSSLGRSRLISRGRRLLQESHADLVVANQLSEGDDRHHSGYLIDSPGRTVQKVTGKKRLAQEILRTVMEGVMKKILAGLGTGLVVGAGLSGEEGRGADPATLLWAGDRRL